MADFEGEHDWFRDLFGFGFMTGQWVNCPVCGHLSGEHTLWAQCAACDHDLSLRDADHGCLRERSEERLTAFWATFTQP